MFIYSIFCNNEVAASGIFKIPEADVYFISRDLVLEYKNSNNSTDDFLEGCWYNIFDGKAGGTNLYDKNENKFIKGNSDVTRVSAIHRSLARRGFCVKMPRCEIGKGFYPMSNSYSDVFFQLGTYEKLFTDNSLKSSWKDPDKSNIPNLNDGACKSLVERDRWLLTNPSSTDLVAYPECKEAVDKASTDKPKGETEDQKSKRLEKICKNFICKTKDVFDELKNEAPYNSDGYCEDIEEPDKSCLESGTDCKGCGFREPSNPDFLNGCVWDQDPGSSTKDSCGDKDVIREKDGYKYFCSVLNKIVRCRETGAIKFNNYKEVFQLNPTTKTYTQNLINSDQCMDIYKTPVCEDECKLDNKGGDPLNCCFGTGSNTCAEKKRILGSLAGGGKYLYCSSDNKVVSCPAGVNPVTGESKIKPYYNAAPLPGELPGVFRNNQFKSTELNLSANCNITDSPTSPVDNPEQVMGDCKIDQDSASCTYGGLSSLENCWKKNFYIKNGKFNLFCNGKDQTIRCKEEIKDYTAAFPGGAPNGTTWNPANDCVPYIPGMDEEIEEEVEQCGLVEEGNIFYIGPGKEMGEGENMFTNGTYDKKKRELGKCIAEGKPETKCYQDVFGAGTDNSKNFYVCQCSTKYNPSYDPLGCSLNPFPDQKNCTERCILVNTSFSDFSTLKTQVAVSPLGLIRTISDFLFAVAVLIFIINMLRASFIYVTSGGDEGKMKEAQSTITNTIFGMIFIVFIGALIRWVTGVATTVVNP